MNNIHVCLIDDSLVARLKTPKKIALNNQAITKRLLIFTAYFYLKIKSLNSGLKIQWISNGHN